MNTHRFARFSMLAAPVAALALASTACGGEKQEPPATAHEAAEAPPPPPPPPSPNETPVKISEDIAHACGISEPDAYFNFDSSKLQSKRSPLDSVAKCFTTGKLAGRSVKLVGRTDPRGESEYNMTLGQSRADAVAAYLEAHGVSPSKTSSSSRGAMDATGTDEKGWAHDRRVDVMLAD